MKIDRMGKESIIIGKRVSFGAIVGGVVSFGVWLWNATHPELEIPAAQAVALTTVLTGMGQVVIANRYGITQ
jgi:ABC-type thiamin/hydroxymethylpyrimidine transport system permease subunit